MSAYRISFLRVVHSEWGKLISLRSTWLVFLGSGLLAAGLAGVINWNSYRQPGAEVSVRALTAQTFLGFDVVTLVLGVFGILMITGEYSSGLVRASFAAVPRRTPVLLAKAAVLILAAVPLMLLVCALSLAVAEIFLPDGQRIGPADLPWRAVLGAAVAPVALALIGLGIGALVRHTAAAVTGYVLFLLVLPALLPPVLPEAVAEDVIRYVPVAAAQALYAVEPSNPFRMLPPGPAALVVAGWVLVALTAGAVVLTRRDP